MVQEENPYKLPERPLHLFFREPSGGVAYSERDRQVQKGFTSNISVSTPEVEGSYGKAAIASIRLHHVLTDFAVQMTSAEDASLLQVTSGQLRNRVLRASEKDNYAHLRPFLLGWDDFLGKQSIVFRNAVAHPHVWHADGSDRIGRIEGQHYTEWTSQRLDNAAIVINMSFLLLNQIFWDVLNPGRGPQDLVRPGKTHQFHARQGGIIQDLPNNLDLLQHLASPRTKS